MDALATYLHDHRAGSQFAVELIESLEKQHPGEDLGRFAVALRVEIEEDQHTLDSIIEDVGNTRIDMTQAAGWILEKVSRLKLGSDGSGIRLGTFEALETLSLGIRGKLALWRVLSLVREIDPRIPPLDFTTLAARADEQFARTEAKRLQIAVVAFARHPG